MEKESLYYLVRDTVATFAERPVYWVKPEGHAFSAVSYFNWRADMKRFSAYLIHHMKMEHGEPVGLLCDNRYEWNLISMGITTVGGVDVPRGCDATPQDIKYILNHTECSKLVVEDEKMLKTIGENIGELTHLKDIICIESKDRFKHFDTVTQKLGKIRLHFLVDCLAVGEEILEREGEIILKKRGEAIKPNDLATIIYTSGTTGAPKGVMLEHRSFCWEVAQIQLTVPLNEQDRTVVFLPPWHIAERLLETTLIACGASMANSTIISLGADMGAIKPTSLVSVPRVWEQLYKRVFDNVRKQPDQKQKIFNLALNTALTRTDIVDTLLDRFAETEDEPQSSALVRKVIATLMFVVFEVLNIPAQLVLKKVKNILGGRIRFAISGAGAMPEHVAVFFRALGIPILDAYGMTETTGVSAMATLPWPKRGAVGRTLPGVQVQLRDEKGRIITRPGEKGVAWHKGPHIMRGYFKAPDKTSDILHDGWLNSGDVFVWTTTGELKFAGRAKDTIVLAGGENVEPGPIEMKILESEYINQVVVVGQDKKTLGALIVPNWERSKEALTLRGVQPPQEQGQWNKDPEVRKFFGEIIKHQVSGTTGFKAFEKVTGFHIMHKEFEKGKEMTETMKIKRNVVFDLYHKEIENLYKD
ncbi:MAG: AMP-binding protein [Spirochaetia bacterium]|nr:AMP-binding protein [Spirochaetia bacterium]